MKIAFSLLGLQEVEKLACVIQFAYKTLPGSLLVYSKSGRNVFFYISQCNSHGSHLQPEPRKSNIISLIL